MKKVGLIVDNSAYLNEEEFKKYDVAKIIPISFIVNGKEYYENENMTYDEFYNFLKDSKTTVSTSQPSIETVKTGWREVLKNYDEKGIYDYGCGDCRGTFFRDSGSCTIF